MSSHHKHRSHDKMSEKELMKSLETPEEKRLRRLAKKEKKQRRIKEEMGWDDEHMGYTNTDNPFGDTNLLNTFVWKKKLEKEGLHKLSKEEIEFRNKQKIEENKLELAKVKVRRLQREKEREERDEELTRIQREKEAASFKEWERQEDSFHLKQARLRSKIRIEDGRAKPIDLLARYISSEEEDFTVEMHEPYIYLNGLSSSDLEDLQVDIKVYMELENGKNLDYWKDLQVIVDDEIHKLRDKSNDHRESINSSVSSEIVNIFKNKTQSQLQALYRQIKTKTEEGGEGVDITYWETLLSRLNAYMARARLRERHQENLRHKLYKLKEEQGIQAEPLFPCVSGNKLASDSSAEATSSSASHSASEPSFSSSRPPHSTSDPSSSSSRASHSASEPSSSSSRASHSTSEPSSSYSKASHAASEPSTSRASHSAPDLPVASCSKSQSSSESSSPSASPKSNQQDVEDPQPSTSSQHSEEMEKLPMQKDSKPQVKQETYDAGRYSPVLMRYSKVEPEILLVDPKEDRIRIEFSQKRLLSGNKLAAPTSALTAAEKAFEKIARTGMDAEEAMFSVEHFMEKSYMWADKYRPRKPRYFNRVHTGFEWNKYNQTHYDIENPPPKLVQGYKFNIFYPDLINKTETPQYTILPCKDNTDFSILKFEAGPPYETIAFKIVNREWEYSYKRGFRCQFHNNIFQLWFHFKRYRYRR